MPSKRAGAKASGAKDAGEDQSDAELLKARRHAESFGTADDCLRIVGWGLQALALAWFFIYNATAPDTPSLHAGAGEASLGLFVAGSFCRALSRASPKGTWSWWRRLWQLGWALALGLLAVCFGSAGLSASTQQSGGPGASSGYALAGLCGLAAAAMAVLCPPESPRGAKSAAACPSARSLVLADGVAGLAIGGSLLAAGPWGASNLAPVAIVAGAMPIGMWGLGTLLCGTEAELLAAVPSAMLMHLGAAARALAVSGPIMAAPPAILLVLHAALYLPLPSHDPNTNPFYTSLKKRLDAFAKLMSDPVSGFGDEG